MKYECWLILLGAAVALGGCAKKDDPATTAELARLKGTWVFDKATVEGQPLPAQPKVEITFEGPVMTINTEGNPTMHTVTIDLGKDPPRLDTVVVNGPTKGATELGIYELADERLKMCIGFTKDSATTDEAKALIGKRPTAFDDKQGVLVILKRKGA